MRRGRIFILLAFILILILAAVLVFWQRVYLPSQAQQQQPEPGATVTVPPIQIVVVSQNIPKGQVLSQEVLTTIPWQAEAVTPGMFRAQDIEKLYGRRVKYDLESQTVLINTMLLVEGDQLAMEGSSWALNIPPGMVAISMGIDRLSSVSYAPRAGDHVNVIVTLMFADLDTDFQSLLPNNTGIVTASGPADPETGERDPLTVRIIPSIQGRTEIDPVLGQAVYLYPSEAQRARYVSQTLLQDVVVLRVGRFPLPSEEGGPQPTPTPTPVPGQEGVPAPPPPVSLPEVVTLIVRPQDAVALNYLIYAVPKNAAALTMALRNSKDDSRETTLPVTLQFLLEQYQVPVPARLPYGLQPRIDSLTR